MTKTISVSKRDIAGWETFQYEGQLVERGETRLVLEARFQVASQQAGNLLSIERGDRFVETYYADRWYNIYAIYAGDTGVLKGWYCNVSYPAEISEEQVAFRDLALDLVVSADGAQEVLDEEEFAALDLPPEDRSRARQALAELQADFRARFAKQKSPR